MAATETLRRAWQALRTLGRALLGGALASGAAHSATLPEDQAETMFHVYDGGGVRASGPALLVRKSLADRVSLSAQYYVDAVSNASIDVVTTASPFKETRQAWDFSAQTVVRDSTITLGAARSSERDYLVEAVSMDLTNEVFGGMTTVSLGTTRSHDKVGKNDIKGFFDEATHWQYRAGVTQILSPRWLVSLNAEVIADSGFLGSPYRAARVFGAAVPERNPRTRSSRALQVRSVLDTGAWLAGSSARAELRYFWDNWNIKAITAEAGFSKYLGTSFLLDTSLRYYTQGHALFYSDNASAETLFVSRNRQLSKFDSIALGAKLSYTWPGLPAGWGVKLIGSVERKQFNYKDFTDLRTDKPYDFGANVLQFIAQATF